MSAAAPNIFPLACLCRFLRGLRFRKTMMFRLNEISLYWELYKVAVLFFWHEVSFGVVFGVCLG